MDPSQNECLNCELFSHKQSLRFPEGCGYAWSVAQMLSGAGIERFGIRDHVIELLDLDSIGEEDFLELVDLLNGIAEGEAKAQEILNKPKKPPGK